MNPNRRVRAAQKVEKLAIMHAWHRGKKREFIKDRFLDLDFKRIYFKVKKILH